MQTKIHLLAMILIFISCTGKKRQEINVISNQDFVIENEIIKIIDSIEGTYKYGYPEKENDFKMKQSIK